MIQVLQAAGPHGQTVSNICFPRQGQTAHPAWDTWEEGPWAAAALSEAGPQLGLEPGGEHRWRPSQASSNPTAALDGLPGLLDVGE